MKCLILAAGYATRLYPLTENFPKPLLKVGGKTILDWLVDDIDGSGRVDEYVVISNHRFAHHFQEWAKTKPQHITVLDDGTESNETRLGAVRDVELAISQADVPTDGYLVIAGDNVLDFSLTRFIDYARAKQTSCIMRFYEPSEQKLLKCGVVTIDEADRVLKGLKGLTVKGRRIGVDIAEPTSAPAEPAAKGPKNRAQRRFEKAQAKGADKRQTDKRTGKKRKPQQEFEPKGKKGKKGDWRKFFKGDDRT